MAKTEVERPFVCEYCKKAFSKQSVLSTHICTQKKRILSKNDQNVRMGFNAYNQFLKMAMGKANGETYEQFVKSKVYTSFVHFGSFLANAKPLYPDKYIEYVIKSGKPIKKWSDDSLYYVYVLNLIKSEHAERAIERSINTMIDWGERTGGDWVDYFTDISTTQAVWDIKDGKLSPWLLLNCDRGKELLKRFDDSQLNSISVIIDLDYWLKKFQRDLKSVELVEILCREYDL